MSRAPSAQKQCRYCYKLCNARGLVSHERKHERDEETARRLANIAQTEMQRGYESLGFVAFAGATHLPPRPDTPAQDALAEASFTPIVGPSVGEAPLEPPPPSEEHELDAPFAEPEASTPLDRNVDNPTSSAYTPIDDEVVRQLGRPAEEDDIRVELPPRGGTTRVKYYTYEDYCEVSSQPPPPPSTTAGTEPSRFSEKPQTKPWFPFQSRVDFELAEWMQDLRLNTNEMDRLLRIIQDIRGKPPGGFNLENAAHVRKLWDIASKKDGTAVTRQPLEGLFYDGQPIALDVWARPLWDWILELVDNPAIVSQFHWDAERISRYDGTEFVRIYTEPWTANQWWAIQLKLPDDGHPICLVLYADKTKLSNFGTRKAYPVYVRCANLPASLRNGKGLCGGRLVGWLPILPEETDKTKRSSFINFKRIVWHKSFAKILESLLPFVKNGCWHRCGDGVWCRLFPIILIMSADYEEMCMMTATRGHGSACPCNICLAPLDGLMNVTQQYERRTTDSMKAAYEKAHAERLASDRDDVLKKLGLRDVENIFWSMINSDIYRALGFDRLHVNHIGVFKHLLRELLAILSQFSRREQCLVEKKLQEFPRWRALNHFTEIGKVLEFSDGRKYEDLSKVIIFAAHQVLSEDETGYQLLKWMRSYLELDMYASLRSHSATTTQMGRTELAVFEKEMKEYSRMDPSKSWNFPKIHAQSHLFDDIEDKGVTINSNTKFNENMHGDLKNYFWDLSNFREVEQIIVRAVTEHVTCLAIREQVDIYDAEQNKSQEQPSDLPTNDDPEDNVIRPVSTLAQTQEVDDPLSRFKIGSTIKEMGVGSLRSHISSTYHRALEGFTSKLNRRLSQQIGRTVRLTEGDVQFSLHRYIRIDYLSCEDSQTATDILRMNPNFYRAERYDCAIIAVNSGYIFARLVGVFEVVYGGQHFFLALIIPFDEPVVGLTAAERKRDADLRFMRVRSRPMERSTFVPIQSIERGALLVPDESSSSGKDYLVMDVVDADLWLRMRRDSLPALLKQRVNI